MNIEITRRVPARLTFIFAQRTDTADLVQDAAIKEYLNSQEFNVVSPVRNFSLVRELVVRGVDGCAHSQVSYLSHAYKFILRRLSFVSGWSLFGSSTSTAS